MGDRCMVDRTPGRRWDRATPESDQLTPESNADAARGGENATLHMSDRGAGRPSIPSIPPFHSIAPIRMTTRSIICIRHGESTFNAAWRAAAVDPLHVDAPLSPVGVEQVRQARRALERLPVELVVTSPLTRALQTAVGLFGGHRHSPRFVVHPLMRERVENSCDVGRSPAELAFEFPALDVAHLDDPWWHVDGVPDHRGICIEPVASVAARALQFKSYLRMRPERCIAVVGHGTFFFHLTGQTLANCEIADVELDTVGHAGAPGDA